MLLLLVSYQPLQRPVKYLTSQLPKQSFICAVFSLFFTPKTRDQYRIYIISLHANTPIRNENSTLAILKKTIKNYYYAEACMYIFAKLSNMEYKGTRPLHSQ